MQVTKLLCYMGDYMDVVVADELKRRVKMWNELLHSLGSPDNVEASVLRKLNFFSGQQGIYRDLKNTKRIASNGVTLSILHTGKHYADDISDTEIIYHYPDTNRTGKTDLKEIEATKNAGRFGLPIFVISSTDHNKRKVRVGRVEEWDDNSKTFLISFVNQPAKQPMVGEAQEDIDKQPFDLTIKRIKSKKLSATSRLGQQKFKFEVIKRYGAKCAVCDLDVYELLQAAHIVPVHHNGCDDPRNGIVLCANHHLAFDKGFFIFNRQHI